MVDDLIDGFWVAVRAANSGRYFLCGHKLRVFPKTG
jgi:hypothetical protein